MHAALQPLREPDEVQEVLRQALELTAELNPPAELQLQTFTLAAQLLTQTVQVQQVPLGAIDLGAIKQQFGS